MCHKNDDLVSIGYFAIHDEKVKLLSEIEAKHVEFSTAKVIKPNIMVLSKCYMQIAWLNV